MTDNRFKRGCKITGPTGTIYMIPSAFKEFIKHIKGDASLEKDFMSLFATWTHAKETLSSYKTGKVYKKIGDLYRVKKSGTQARLLGYREEGNFFVVKCLKKKKDKIDKKDIDTANQRKKDFNIEAVKWEDLK